MPVNQSSARKAKRFNNMQKKSGLNPVKLRHLRLRKKVVGSASRPRLCVHFSAKNIYVQLVDDSAGITLASVSTTETSVKEGARANVATASRVGRLIAERAIVADVRSVVFDRGGWQFHGKVKALADAAREAGLNF
jgi:large subunit ribosomal protein L18